MADLPFEDKIDLKLALDELIKTKGDAIDVMVYITLKWKLNEREIAQRVNFLRLKGRDRVVILGKRN